MTTVYPCESFGLEFFDEAPVRCVYERELNCSPDTLFNVLEDPASWPVWGTGIARVNWTSPQPYRVGTTRTVTFHGGGMEVFETFIAWERGHQMAFCLSGATQEVWRSFGENYVVRDLGNGKCHLTWTVAYAPMGLFKTIQPIARPIMGWWLGRLATNLGRYVDALHPE